MADRELPGDKPPENTPPGKTPDDPTLAREGEPRHLLPDDAARPAVTPAVTPPPATPPPATTPPATTPPATTPPATPTATRRTHAPVDPIVDTDQIPIVTDDAESDTGARPATDPTPATPQRRGWRDRNWKHIKGTRVRSGTAILVVLFVACWVMYGYTSQRYAPPEQPSTGRQVVRTSEPTYREPTTSYSSTTSSSVSSSDSGESSVQSGAPGAPGAGEESSTGQSSAPSGGLIPGFRLPWETTTTTTVPTR
ncbi:hypothetical protein [Gordonia sp. i37]|uniref:hypothetical protein n=1 Tax=Gordonia sp. i37 TaxID=1961707 RepID=UPI0009AEB921|nr:hypothetical protein [Gordonia sp. i37]OPX14227.1 hypothetical protein B1964_16165 [Gordonia sp. i37]